MSELERYIFLYGGIAFFFFVYGSALHFGYSTEPDVIKRRKKALKAKKKLAAKAS